MRISATANQPIVDYDVVLTLDLQTAKELYALLCHNVTIPNALREPSVSNWGNPPIDPRVLASRFLEWAPLIRGAIASAVEIR